VPIFIGRGAPAPSHDNSPLLFPHAILDEVASLRSDDFLVDRLLQAIDARLRHAKLHLILPILAFHILHGGQASRTLAAIGR
jgi:hypothetical protein